MSRVEEDGTTERLSATKPDTSSTVLHRGRLPRTIVGRLNISNMRPTADEILKS
jgi:hypothetical protein